MPRSSAGKHEDFHNFSHLTGKKSFDILGEFLTGRPVRLCPVHDPRMDLSNLVSFRLKKLIRHAQLVFQETGSQDLYLAYLFVQGAFSNGNPVRAPLILVPAGISRVNGYWTLQMKEEARPAINKSFLLAYSFHQSKGISDLINDDLFENAESIQDIKTTLIESFKKAEIDINFQADIYAEQIEPFRSFTRSEFDKNHKPGILKVYQESLLGLFPQSDSYLEPDYRALINSGLYPNAEDFFKSLDCPEPLAEPSESRLVCAYPADPWQEQALRKIKRGYSIVVEGPPGTGKSQLICNLISDALASRKTVLVVSQKKAALDVVWNRLKAAGLHSFASTVHDFRADRKSVFSSIDRQIQFFNEYREQNRSIDSIQLDRQFQKTSNRIDQIIEQLQEFRLALSDEQICGMSIKEMYLHASTDVPVISLRNELHLLRMDQSDDLERKIHALAFLRKVLDQEAPSWKHRISFAGKDRSDLKNLLKILHHFNHDFEEIISPIEIQCSIKPDYSQMQSLLGDFEKVSSLSGLLVPAEFGFLNRLIEHISEEASDLWLANLQRMVEACFQGEGVENTLSLDQLGLAQQMLNRSVSAHKNIFSRLWWKLFSKDKFLVSRLLVVHKLKGLPGLQSLEKKLDNRLNLEHLVSKLQEQNWTYHIPTNYHGDHFRNWFEATRRALRIKDTITSSRIMPQIFGKAIASSNPDQFIQCAAVLQEQIRKFGSFHDSISKFLSLRQIETLISSPETYIKLSAEIENQFDRVVAADELFRNFQDWERAILERLEEMVPDGDPDQIVSVLHNSMLTGWIQYLEARTPLLRMVQSGELELLEKELQELDQIKRNLGSKMTLLRAREKIVEDVSLNRLNNVVTYRELLHQVTKKKKIWPLRKLISEFQDEIFRLVPCWMASPEAVSALFPLEKNFDLVIFDEASQCFPEWGIPAICRAKQLVVAGDSQQLRPSDFYRIRWQQDEEDQDPYTESESLLEMVRFKLPVLTLQAHYRSQHPDLIAFSNRNFYQNRLLHLPDRDYYNSKPCAFEYINVQGFWENQSNQKEAEAVAELILKFSSSEHSASIGVITFNQIQQQLIMDTIEIIFAEHQASIPENLFIKNIENVQGDERDIIIFSVGYAASKSKTNRVSLQFGSLNQEGGVNRLNVAVSRARQRMIIITSIEPQELDVDSAKSAGPAMLKSWLEFVKEYAIAPSQEWRSTARSKESIWYLSDRLLQRDELKGRLFPPPFAFADLVTLIDGKYQRIILTDDERYLQAPSSKFHHCYLPELIRSKNWPSTFCYSRSYWLDPSKLDGDILTNYSGQEEDYS